MFPSRSLPSRYLRVARRAHLARLVAAGAVVVIPAACGGGDADTFDVASRNTTVIDTPTTDDATSTSETTTSETSAITEVVSTSEPTTVPSTEAAYANSGASTAASSGTFPAGAEVVVEFTYAAASSGRVHNPYVAVWVEDLDGNLVTTLGVWYEQSGKGTRWISDLLQWSSISGGSADASVTGATRTPGTYTLAWDGTDDSGALVAEGDYVLFVESAREHGPYQITSSTITVSGDGFIVSLPDDGELTDLTATMTV